MEKEGSQKLTPHINVRAETIKHLENNIGVNVYNFGFSKSFLYMTPKAMSNEGKIDKLELIKIKTFVIKEHQQ